MHHSTRMEVQYCFGNHTCKLCHLYKVGECALVWRQFSAAVDAFTLSTQLSQVRLERTLLRPLGDDEQVFVVRPQPQQLHTVGSADMNDDLIQHAAIAI